MLQQHLPFTVLKLKTMPVKTGKISFQVATALTVYGIETYCRSIHNFHNIFLVATALTVYGIETFNY